MTALDEAIKLFNQTKRRNVFSGVFACVCVKGVLRYSSWATGCVYLTVGSALVFGVFPPLEHSLPPPGD